MGASVHLQTGLTIDHRRLYHDLCFLIAFNEDKAPNQFIDRLHKRLESMASAKDMADATEWIRDGKAFVRVNLGDKSDYARAVLIRAMWVQDRLNKANVVL
jgi:hypothetical protein